MNRDPRGYYAALHVAPDATAAEIQRAFRALMRLRHPDVEASSGAGQGTGNNAAGNNAAGNNAAGSNATGNNAGDEARRILESFAVLRDPESRAEYDPASAPAGPGRTAPGGREIPVRHHRPASPVLRVTPVRWERGPL